MKIDFLAIGELLADVISADYCDSLETATFFQRFQGGSPSNVAANVKWLGKNADVVSCVGDDGIGRFLIAEIKRIGISGQYIQINKVQPTSIVLVTKSRGTPDFIAYRTADAHLSEVEESLIDSAAILHTTAFALSQEPSRGVILRAFEKGKESEKQLSVDWNFAPSIWGADNGKEVFKQLADLEVFLKISIDDMERFTRKGVSIEACKDFLEAYQFSFICLTCGKVGVWYKELTGQWKFKPSVPVEEVMDTTGAGDAFWAGFIVAYTDKKSFDDCIQNGLTVAAKKIQKQGPLYGGK